MSAIDDPAYDLVPAYREAGPRLVLVWWTHQEQHHAIVARYEIGLARAWDRVLAKHRNAEIRQMWRARVVDPPEHLCAIWRKRAHRRDLQNFRMQVIGLAKDIELTTGALPPQFAKCPRHPADRRHAQDDDYNCARCGGDLIVWCGPVPWRDFHAAKGHVFREPRTDPAPRPAHASEVADPAAPLYVAIADPGHHCSGVRVGPVAPPEFYVAGAPLFFFQGEETPPPAAVAESLARVRARREAEEVENKAKRLARMAQQEREYAESVARLAKEVFECP